MHRLACALEGALGEAREIKGAKVSSWEHATTGADDCGTTKISDESIIDE